MSTPVIAFNTANLVARFSNYTFTLKEWGKQDQLTRQRTTADEFEQICREIKACGYNAAEIWIAHIDPPSMTPERVKRTLRSLHENGICPVGIAGGIDEANARVMLDLGIRSANGGFWAGSPDVTAQLCRKHNLLFNYENHPEKSVDEIRQKCHFGANGFAVAVDTGWLGTQSVEAPKAIRELGRLIRHVHLKDVAHAGAHDTVKLGTGCVDIPGCVRELKAIGYEGILSWEDEPENRNPYDIAIEMREYIERLWKQ